MRGVKRKRKALKKNVQAEVNVGEVPIEPGRGGGGSRAVRQRDSGKVLDWRCSKVKTYH